MKKKAKVKKLITHDGSFHADDVFACATLCLFLEKKKEKYKIIRTRDKKIIKNGDYVFDVGEIYNENKNFFDHHQSGGAGKRANGIEYSSFGLVWKKFGKNLVRSKNSIAAVDDRLVASIDAYDNGFDLIKKIHKIYPYFVQDVFSAFRPTALEDIDEDTQFFKVLKLAILILKREIKKADDQIYISKMIQNIYKKTKNKKIIVIDMPKLHRYEVWNALEKFPEVLFMVRPKKDRDYWKVEVFKKDLDTFGSRKDLPKSWGGLSGEKLQKITGVSEAIFCHKNLFMLLAKTKEAAIKLAQIAIEL